MAREHSLADGAIVAETQPSPGDDNVLFPCEARRIEIEHALTHFLADARARQRMGAVRGSIAFAVAENALSRFDFQDQMDLEDVLAWLIQQMNSGMTHVTHPRYFGLFNPTPTFTAECADRIAAAFNPQLASATTSPFPVALELHVLRALANRLGMPAHTTGHFTTGGSEANATAVLCALTHVEPRYAHDGMRAFKAAPRMYVSGDAHLAWLKIGHQTGIGRSAVRLIATDGDGRMNVNELGRCMTLDREQGFLPCLVVSTAGTTSAGMIDRLKENAAIANHFGAWHHVDAAWGGGLVASDKLIGALHGIELAHSVTIDAHKWFATTMGCGMFLTSRPHVLSDTFHVTMDCMPSNEATLDPYVTTIQWSRRFLGIRLFVGLASGGWKSYAAHVEKAVDLAALLRTRMSHDGWCVVNESPLAVVCLRPPKRAPEARVIADAAVRSGRVWISSVKFNREDVIRVCMTSGETTPADVIELAEVLNRAARTE